jgi:hypothetical protein
MPAASFVTLSTKASCSMANPRRAKSLLELAEEDLAGARLLLGVSTRLARYHVQQCAEKAVKAARGPAPTDIAWSDRPKRPPDLETLLHNSTR